MQHLKTILIALSAISAVSAAPAPATANKDILLKNGKDAQQLNAVFRSLNATAPCETGDFACVNNDISICTTDGTWRTARRGKCNKPDSCFAVPDTKEDAVNLMCTTEANALLLFESTGVTGGIFGDVDGNSSTTTTASTTAPATEATSITSVTPTSTGKASVTTTVTKSATVTVTQLPGQFTTTSTISPSQASEILSSVKASSISTTSTSTRSKTITLTTSPTGTFSTTVKSSSVTSAPSSSSPSPSVMTIVTTILLTLSPSSQSVAPASTAAPLGGGLGAGYRRAFLG